MSIDIEEMRKREQAATPGPWAVFDDYLGLNVRTAGRRATSQSRAEMPELIAHGTSTGDVEFDAADAEFIAHAREDVPALLDEVERHREALEAVKARDDYLITRAERAEAERDHLRAALDAVRALADSMDRDAAVILREAGDAGLSYANCTSMDARAIRAALDEHLGEP